MELICKICGKTFKVKPSRTNTAKYCSSKCQHDSLKGELNCTCEICGKKFHRKQSWINKNKHSLCSTKCANKLKETLYLGKGNHQFGLKGDLNASFKGKELTRNNRKLVDIKVYCPEHPNKDRNNRVLKHRLIIEEYYYLFNNKYFEIIDGKYYLKRKINVHHINGDHNDNRIENLMPVTRSEHKTIHMLEGIQIRDPKTGKLTAVLKRGELLEKPEEVNQQPSLNGNILEGSETNSRVLTEDSNADTSALPA